MNSDSLDVPPDWLKIDLHQLRGTVMVIGAPDTGKSTFAQFIIRYLLKNDNKRIAFLDGDPGQTSLGVSTTISVVLSARIIKDEVIEPENVKRYFIGSNSPQGHMLSTLVGGCKLLKAAEENGIELVIYDTSGLIGPEQGGMALKSAKIDLYQPSMIFAIQSGDNELEPLLHPYRQSKRIRIIDLSPSLAIQKKDQECRRLNRSCSYRKYFECSQYLTFNMKQFPIFPFPRFSLNRLIAFENGHGFADSLGVISDLDRERSQFTVFTPLHSARDINAIRIGDIFLDINTYVDQQILQRKDD